MSYVYYKTLAITTSPQILPQPTKKTSNRTSHHPIQKESTISTNKTMVMKYDTVTPNKGTYFSGKSGNLSKLPYILHQLEFPP